MSVIAAATTQKANILSWRVVWARTESGMEGPKHLLFHFNILTYLTANGLRHFTERAQWLI